MGTIAFPSDTQKFIMFKQSTLFPFQRIQIGIPPAYLKLLGILADTYPRITADIKTGSRCFPEPEPVHTCYRICTIIIQTVISKNRHIFCCFKYIFQHNIISHYAPPVSLFHRTYQSPGQRPPPFPYPVLPQYLSVFLYNPSQEPDALLRALCNDLFQAHLL